MITPNYTRQMSHFWRAKRNNNDFVASNQYGNVNGRNQRMVANFGARVPVHEWSDVKQYLMGHPEIRYMRWQLEQNTENAEGKPHYQVFITMAAQMDISTFRGKTRLGQGGFSTWVQTQGQSNKEMADYAWKDDQVVRDDDGEIVDRGEHGVAPQWRSPNGQRAQPAGMGEKAMVRQMMLEIASNASIPISMATVLVENAGLSVPAMAPYIRQMNDQRTMAQKCSVLSPPTNMKVFVFYGNAGTGKSASAKYNAIKYYGGDGFAELQAAQGTGKMWMCNIGAQRTLLINDYGHNKYAEITTLLNLLDPEHVNKVWETKGGQTRVKFDRIIITSNYHPRQWFPKADHLQLGALLRRITKTVQFTGKLDFGNQLIYNDKGQVVPQVYDMERDRFVDDGIEQLNAFTQGQQMTADGFVIDEADGLEKYLAGKRSLIKFDELVTKYKNVLQEARSGAKRRTPEPYISPAQEIPLFSDNTPSASLGDDDKIIALNEGDEEDEDEDDSEGDSVADATQLTPPHLDREDEVKVEQVTGSNYFPGKGYSLRMANNMEEMTLENLRKARINKYMSRM